MIWGLSIVLYLFLAGAGAGAFIVCALAALRQPEPSAFQRVGRIVSLAAVVVGLVLLMVDAQAGFSHPLRFALLLGNFNSVMTWGVVFLGLFAAADAATVVLACLQKAVPKWLDVCGMMLALCVAVYTGILLGVVDTFPLWNLAVLPVLFLVSAISTGIATALLVAQATGYDVALLKAVRGVHPWLPLVELALVAALLVVTTAAGPAGSATVASLASGSYAMAFWLGLVVIGLAVPFLLGLATQRGARLSTAGSSGREGTITAASASVVVAELCVLVGGFMLRYLIVVAALPLTLPALGL